MTIGPSKHKLQHLLCVRSESHTHVAEACPQSNSALVHESLDHGTSRFLTPHHVHDTTWADLQHATLWLDGSFNGQQHNVQSALRCCRLLAWWQDLAPATSGARSKRLSRATHSVYKASVDIRGPKGAIPDLTPRGENNALVFINSLPGKKHLAFNHGLVKLKAHRDERICVEQPAIDLVPVPRKSLERFKFGWENSHLTHSKHLEVAHWCSELAQQAPMAEPS